MKTATAATAAEQTTPAFKSYTVVAGAVVLTTGRKLKKDDGRERDEVIRLHRGDTINSLPDNPRIAYFRSVGSIVPTEEFDAEKSQLRVLDVARKSGADLSEDLIRSTTATKGPRDGSQLPAQVAGDPIEYGD